MEARLTTKVEGQGMSMSESKTNLIVINHIYTGWPTLTIEGLH